MIRVLGKFQAKPDHREDIKSALLDVVKGSVNEPGCLRIRLFQDKNNPNLFFGYEVFADEASVAAHREQPYEVALIKLVEHALEGPPEAFLLGPAIAGMEKLSPDRPLNPQELLVIALFEMKPDHRGKMVAQYEKQIPNVRAQDGCIAFNAFTVLNQEHQLAVIEHWETQEIAREFSMTDPLSMESGQVLAGTLERPIPDYLHELSELKPQ